MNRCEITKNHVKKISPSWLWDHLRGVAEASAELAKRRGLDPELAEIAGWLHDIARAVDPYADKHGPAGAKLAADWLSQTGLFQPEEVEQIRHAIYYHSKKRLIHSPFDEVLKDGDVYDHVVSGLFLDKDQDRIKALMLELA